MGPIWKYIVFVLSLFVAASSAGAEIGCGAVSGGLAAYDQTQCGNVAASFSAVGGSITSCGTYNGTFTLAQDIGTNASDVCLTIGSGSTINLGGRTVTGLIRLTDAPVGTRIYNGSVRCSATVNSVACVYGSFSAPITAPLILDHLTLLNLNTASGTSGQALFIDWNPSTVSIPPPQVQISYITSSAPAVSSSPRTGNVWINGNSKWTAELHHLDLTCGPNSNACQGLSLWGGRAHLHHSRVKMSNVSLSQDGRAFICDGDATYCEANNNYIDVQNNRAFRLRQYSTSGVAGPLIWHDNLLDNIKNSFSRAAIHLCDPDANSSSINANNAQFYRNTLILGSGGTGVWAINCRSPGPVFHDNRVKCLAAGNCGSFARPTAEYGVATSMTAYNNVLDAGLSGMSAPNNTTVRHCNSGSCQASGGTCELISPCPAPEGDTPPAAPLGLRIVND